jgi:hypothetical protein
MLNGRERRKSDDDDLIGADVDVQILPVIEEYTICIYA